jgi:hypothetical protein
MHPADLEGGDLLGVVPARVKLVEEGLGRWRVVILLEPVQDVRLYISPVADSLTSCFQQFIVSWYSCWFLCRSMSMMERSVTARFFSNSWRILIRIIEGDMLRA